jgi:hypothetical protein
MVSRSKGFTLLLSLVVMGVAASAAAQSCMSVTPANLVINFPPKAINTQSLVQDVVIQNVCQQGMNIESFSFTTPGFKLLAGWAPFPIPKGQKMTYEVVFAPTAAQTYTGNFTVNVAGYAPVVVAMTGTGTYPGAVLSSSSTSLTFTAVPLGTTVTQNVTLTNNGNKGTTIVDIYTDPPFGVSGFTVNQVIKANSQITLPVTFTPGTVGSFNGTLVVTTNNLPPMGATLYGTAVKPSSLAVTSFPTLPSATQGAAYLTTLHAASNAIGSLNWKLAAGSSLPSGLILNQMGTITGTVASTVAVGSYPFTVSVTNSTPSTTTMQMTLPVGAPTGATCNNIDWDVAGTTTPIVDMQDLGTGTYLGAEGGLYLNGSNVMPASQDAAGVSFGQAIQPLDAEGNPDPGGKYAMLSIGMSIAYDNFQTFTIDATADPSVNPALVLVPGAQPRVGAVDWADLTHPAWTDIMDYFLPQSGVTAQQVVVAWVEAVNSQPTGTFPADMTALQANLESIAQNLHTLFPNLTMAFFNSREYAGYSNGLPGSGVNDPEPYAYESGYAVRGMIQDQLNGVAAMNYNPANGPVMAPWVAWGPYSWANGLIARSDGQVWTCQNFESDGVHTSQTGGGTERIANMLMNFMKTDDATAPWFLAQ